MAKIFWTSSVPRLCVFRSSSHIYAQLIDDEKGVTLAAANNKGLKSKSQKKKAEKDKKSVGGKVAAAYELGKLIADIALKKRIEKVVFDRGGYKYHGRVKALAQGAREGGLKF